MGIEFFEFVVSINDHEFLFIIFFTNSWMPQESCGIRNNFNHWDLYFLNWRNAFEGVICTIFITRSTQTLPSLPPSLLSPWGIAQHACFYRGVLQVVLTYSAVFPKGNQDLQGGEIFYTKSFYMLCDVM